ncbi:Nuclear hormone receptor family member nhr-136 [Caenorhabditis elegans]|uniref:Nuclear hormone receptor family member nhr-136 n=1 Tax=Caenorhabditis elegans TaxID=6239 RepID=NH136_CAEEL|nr:Nuclear hormone receptor family member nhr-136 [Caenorhabditis elegans]O01930.2 RecName: Full=Nuclear hormone receptor family member nhr-136 [Caenorhabditis elegans]CAB07314.2 Nuclear hormone receptor family member nhr-136 [Caenorhabditis elegans]|eukprot:NP_506039.2 Nuclear hormone receptor family member nhr-136 [Caenorhabditis elegans]
MLPDFITVPSTSEKCLSPELLLPNMDENLEDSKPSSLKYQKAMMSRGTCPSNCKVCRHSATGYHYDVPSCNGCKTFFRRSILDGRKYTCLKMRKCLSGTEPVDLSRRMCRACRFEKCVEAGMNPSAIQADMKTTDGELLRKEIMIKQKTAVDFLNTPQVIMSFEDKVQGIIGKLTVMELKIEPLYTGGLPPGNRDIRKLDELIDAPLILSYDEIPNLKYCPSVDELTGEIKPSGACYIHCGYLASIEYSKMFDFAHKIDVASKATLIKHATIMCADIMTAFFSYYQRKSDRLIHPNGMFAGPPKYRYGEAGTKYQASMQRTLATVLRHELNRIEYMLLKAIVLCNPAVSSLSISVQQIIGKEREEYVRTLLTYCLLNYGSVHGPSRFSALLAIMSVLESQQKNAKDFHLLAKATILKDAVRYTRISNLYEQIMES